MPICFGASSLTSSSTNVDEKSAPKSAVLAVRREGKWSFLCSFGLAASTHATCSSQGLLTLWVICWPRLPWRVVIESFSSIEGEMWLVCFLELDCKQPPSDQHVRNSPFFASCFDFISQHWHVFLFTFRRRSVPSPPGDCDYLSRLKPFVS